MGKESSSEEDQVVPSGYINNITFTVSTQAEKEKLSVVEIDAVNQVVDSRLGLPNLSAQCSTCGHKNPQRCEGHFGIIELPFTIIHPHFLSEVAKILNHVCPACKTVRKDVKGRLSRDDGTNCCVYCNRNSCYPRMRFRVSSLDSFRKTALTVDVAENKLKRLLERLRVSPSDYWKFIPKDDRLQESFTKSTNSRVLSHAQVHSLLSDIDPKIIQKFVSRRDALFLNSLPVTPNSHRVTEVAYPLFNGQTLLFDERTKAYKRLVGFRGVASELSSYVVDCLKVSKLVRSDISNKDSVFTRQNKFSESVSHATGLRWMKDVVLGKRNDYSIRMVVTGDPNIKLSEIGIPRYIAERLQISERLTYWNHDKIIASCDLLILEKGVVTVRRKDRLVHIYRSNQLRLGDSMCRNIIDGDIILVLRPPSIHQHSLIGLCVKILPNSSSFSLNPLLCSPLRGDFDGDCLHGYIPQSLDARVELMELVSIEKQLFNGQSGRSLLSLSQDSLTAAHLVMEDGVFLNHFQMQQLQMYTPYNFPYPAVIKSPSLNICLWTGKQIISMLLPMDFSFVHSSSGVHVSEGEVLSHSKGSAFVNDNDTILFQSLIKHCQWKAPEFLFAAQEVFCEWLSMRGLSVSLSDLYLATDSSCRKNLMNEVLSGLEEAEDASNVKAMMINSFWQLSAPSGEEKNPTLRLEHLFYEKQKSAALSRASFDAFKKVFWAVQNLVPEYKGRDNSLWSMYKAGSKGNLLRIVQQSLCLGLQHSLVPLSFRFPRDLSCTGLNDHKLSFSPSKTCDIECSKSYVPCAVVKSSYLSGLNPLESFVHSVVSRDSAFGKHADLPGTLSRKLMFFLRDISIGYDGTVRNAYGSQLVQLSYNANKNASASINGDHRLSGEAGQPVGSLSACAISEAAYSALDQPIGLLETSPLLNLKNVLECGSKKSNAIQTASLFLSNKLERWQHGYEYGALEVKNHLERLFFEDIVSSVMIVFSPQSQMHFSPWVCHFHICKELAKRKGLKANFIITSLRMRCSSARIQAKSNLPSLLITSKYCLVAETYKETEDTFCITVSLIESPKKPSIRLDWIQNFIVPFLLQTVIKGFMEITKVDILWSDRPKSGSSRRGELYLRVSMSGESSKTKCWGLLDRCLQIMDMIDWSRSHPDRISDFSYSFGIDAGWKYFLDNLESAVSDIGKNVLPEHLLLIANALSMSGEFVGLNARGILQQREHASVSSPFMQACFSNPGDCFAKAAKSEYQDGLKGSIDALAWGNSPPVGTGGQFDIIYAGEGTGFSEPIDIYSMLSSQVSSPRHDVKIELPNGGSTGVMHSDSSCKRLLRSIPKAVGSCWTFNDIQKLAQAARHILKESPINQYLREKDRSILMQILNFHPRRDEKIGLGAQNIKVENHPEYQNSRCFKLVRQDGSMTDFSYHKCVLNALEMIAPEKAKLYRLKNLRQS